MIKRIALISFALLCYASIAQEGSLPADLRQHALTQYNASLFNPTFALDRNNPQSISIWTRWQWQQIDADPTTLFINYTRSLNDKSTIGGGFFQHNTGIYFNTGGVINYAYEVKLNPIIKLAIGGNLFGFQQQLADTRFLPDPDLLPIPVSIADDFILQLAPGFNLSVENFSLGISSENLFDYNLNDKEANTETSDKIFMGMASYDLPVMASDSTAFLKPSIYLRTIPEQDNQIGVNTLFSTQKYWAQAGYNNFYGISVGAGGTVFNRFSVGALVEFGTGSSLNTKDASFELIASYFLGNPKSRRKAVVNVFDTLEEEVILTDEELATKMKEELEKAEQLAAEEEEETGQEEMANDSLAGEVVSKRDAKKQLAEERAVVKQRKKDSLSAVKIRKSELAETLKEEKEKAAKLAAASKIQVEKQKDSLEQIRKMEAIADSKSIEAKQKAALLKQVNEEEAVRVADQKEKQEKRQDSLRTAEKLLDAEKAKAAVTEVEKVTPRAGEKYEEVITEDGLEPGYYLIANVFGTKKYFDAFMGDLQKKGITGGSFLRSSNNYNYAYLKRYNTIREARRARDSKFDGKYQAKTWIFRVVGK